MTATQRQNGLRFRCQLKIGDIPDRSDFRKNITPAQAAKKPAGAANRRYIGLFPANCVPDRGPAPGTVAHAACAVPDLFIMAGTAALYGRT